MQHYMTREERYQLEALYKAKIPVAQIARQLGFCRQTIYNEIKRGLYTHTCDFYDELRYSAQKAQQKHDYAQTAKGKPLKIGNDYSFANYISDCIIKKHYSPAAALAEAKTIGYKTSICVNTLYNYIDAQVFEKLRREHCPNGKRKHRCKQPQSRIVHPKLPSIEQRPEQINNRSEYGHWEMDLIVSGKGGHAALLVLVERAKRQQIIRKIPNKSADTVLGVLNKLRRQYFIKSITTDNGSEFMCYEGIKALGIDVYYCHSYAAWEKGQVEKHNQIIRRWLPKGTIIDKVSVKQIKNIENWMNNYPRKLLNWMTPYQACQSLAGSTL